MLKSLVSNVSTNQRGTTEIISAFFLALNAAAFPHALPLLQDVIDLRD